MIKEKIIRLYLSMECMKKDCECVLSGSVSTREVHSRLLGVVSCAYVIYDLSEEDYDDLHIIISSYMKGLRLLVERGECK